MAGPPERLEADRQPADALPRGDAVVGCIPRSHGSERSFVRRRTRFRRSTRGGRRLCRGDCRSEAGCRAAASSGWPGSATRGPGTGRMHGARSGLDAVWLRRRPPPSGGRHDARFSHQPAGGVRKISGAAAQREVIPAVGARIVGSRRHEPWCRGRPPLAMGGAHHRRAVETPRPRPLTIARRRSGRFGVLVVMPLRGRARVLRRRVAHPLDAFADHRVGQGDPGERSGLERRGRGVATMASARPNKGARSGDRRARGVRTVVADSSRVIAAPAAPTPRRPAERWRSRPRRGFGAHGGVSSRATSADLPTGAPARSASCDEQDDGADDDQQGEQRCEQDLPRGLVRPPRIGSLLGRHRAASTMLAIGAASRRRLFGLHLTRKSHGVPFEPVLSAPMLRVVSLGLNGLRHPTCRGGVRPAWTGSARPPLAPRSPPADAPEPDAARSRSAPRP